jgi:hypothetical protein
MYVAADVTARSMPFRDGYILLYGDTTCIPQPRFGSWRFPAVGGER